MAEKKKLRAAILGFGGMGHVHAAQYTKDQKDVELVACCDIDKAQFERTDVQLNFGSSGQSSTKLLRKYLSYEDFAKHEKGIVDIVDIALPSDLHCEYAIRAMKDGFHVLCEKPMALNYKDCLKMIRASEETGKFLMIAQCVRFDKAYLVIKDAFDSGKYGKLLRLSTHRMGALPGGWFRDVKRSGGALLDLHLHDLDFFQYMLGKPSALISFGTAVFSGGIDDSVTNYIYDNGPIVTSEGSWARPGWSCGMTAIFEKGTVEVSGGKVILYQKDKKNKELKWDSAHNCYFHEIAYFAHCVKTGTRPEKASPESTAESIRLIELEQRSALAGGKKIRV